MSKTDDRHQWGGPSLSFTIMSTSNGFESTEAVAHYLKKLLAYEFGEIGELQMLE